MNEWFAFCVDDHLKSLESLLVDLNRIDSYPLDQVDQSRMGQAKRNLKSATESFRRTAEAARLNEDGVAA